MGFFLELSAKYSWVLSVKAMMKNELVQNQFALCKISLHLVGDYGTIIIQMRERKALERRYLF